MKINILYLIFSFFASFCWAQTTEVTGTIKDLNHKVVPYANVVFTNVSDSLKTFGILGHEDGSFSILIPKDIYKVDVIVIGSSSSKLDIDLREVGKEYALGDIYINTTVRLEGITISAEGLDYKLELDKKIYNISKDLLAKGGHLIDVMQNLPSIQVEVDDAVTLRRNAGVRILIDGSPSGFTNSSNLLRTIPAHAVERIEVITNPSSKYTSEGTGGIINVVLKKGKKKRLSQSIEVFSGLRFNSGLNMNVTQVEDKSSWYINTGIGYSKPKSIYELKVRNELDTIIESHQYSEKILGQLYLIANIGGQRKLNENQSISADITYRIANAYNPTKTNYKDFNDWGEFSLSERLDEENIRDHYLQANLGYEIKINSDATLNIKSNTQINIEDELSNILEEYIQPFQSIISKDKIQEKNNRIKQIVSINYVHPIVNNIQLEAGLESRYTKTKNDFFVENFKNETWNTIPYFDNQFEFRENVTSVYGQFAKRYTKLKFQIGIRSELTDIAIDSEQNIFSKSNHYIDFFPSGFLSYDFNEMHKVRFSISRRIGRPKSTHLFSGRYLRDNRNIFMGNDELKPSYSTLLELGYRSNISENFSITPTLFYSKTSNAIDYFLQKQSDSNIETGQPIFASTPINVSANTSYGLELGFSYTMTNWLSMYCEIRSNKFKQSGQYGSVIVSNSGAVVHGRYHFNFKLPKAIRFQIQNRFRNGNTRGQLERRPVYRMDIGLSKNFNDKATLTLNAKDIFNTWAFRIERLGEEFVQQIKSQVRVPQLNLSFIYQVNQKKYNGKKGRQYDKIQL